MAMTDQEMQFLQGEVQDRCSSNSTEPIYDDQTGEYYKVVNKQDGTTQAIAVAPCDKNGKNVDYDQTAIVVYGTQPGLNESTGNAFSAFRGMTPQYSDVEDFYVETEKKVNKHDGEITNMSGYSQSGPAVAKVAADHRVDKITNFADWGGQAAYDNGDITEEDKKYLDKHATIYTDSDKDLTWANKGGRIPYGKKVVVEGSHDLDFFKGDHNYNYPQIKGNGPNIEWYVKHHQFCSGMTKEQAREVAEYKAKHDSNPFKDADDYIKEYEKTYGYAKEKTKKSKSKDKNKAKKTSSTALDKKLKDGKGLSLKELLKRYKGAKGSKRRVLRKALLFAGLSAVLAEVGDLAEKVQQLMDESRSEVQDIVEDTRSKAFSFAKELDAGEVESLLSEIDFDRVWSQGAEQANIAQAKAFTGKVESLGSNVMSAGDAIEQADQVASQALASFTQDIISQYN